MSSPPGSDFYDRSFNTFYFSEINSTSYYLVTVPPFPPEDFLYYDTVFEWLLTETSGNFYINNHWFAARGVFNVYLEDAEEAMLFKLRWGGECRLI